MSPLPRPYSAEALSGFISGYAVANTADGFNPSTLGAKFLAQTADMRVDRAGLDFSLVIPDIHEEMFARQHAATALHKLTKKPELCGCKLDWLAMDSYFMTFDIKDNLAYLKARDFFDTVLRCSAEQRTDS